MRDARVSSLNLSSRKIESDQECDACAAVIVVVAMIESEEQQSQAAEESFDARAMPPYISSVPTPLCEECT